MLPGVGGFEYIVIAILLIIFVSPKDLPGLIIGIGKIFKKIKKLSLEFKEMIKVFNMGIGFVICVNEKDLKTLTSILKSRNERFYILGSVIKGNEFRVT